MSGSQYLAAAQLLKRSFSMRELMIIDPEKLHAYMRCMHQSIDAWEDSLRKRNGVDWLSFDEIQVWLKRVRVTLEIMENVYIFDEKRSLIVETLGSGFPKRQHFDHINFTKRTARYDKGRIQTVKRSFLNELFSNGDQMPSLDRIARSLAFDLLFQNEVLEAFHFSGIERISNNNTREDAFVCSWERISDGVPVKYVMLFDVSDGWSIREQDMNELVLILRERTLFLAPMERIARSIDVAHTMIHPKWVGRIILGPVFISGVTCDDHALQSALNIISSEDMMKSASRIIYEYVISEKEVPVEGVHDQKGRLHTTMQKYVVRYEQEHYQRGVTHLEKTLFAEHDIIQKLEPDFLREIGHTIYGH